ncbi:MAG: CPBP family intramembrane metalloprotease [Chitinophagaceae bacterium]|nr:MAG: CPBP family intramembrane metalloprotease [Chitinophagaceae bacterium]
MDNTAKHGYGLKKTTNISVYFLFLILMLPFISLASFSASFLEQYPRAFKALESSQQTSILHWLVFETVYALNFLSIEFFFRSFLIIAFLRISGVHAIIPAACFYCCIHFDKPLAEATSSFFGGWLLGIISYNTKSIWGGWLVHVGIAWLMELFAFLQHQ